VRVFIVLRVTEDRAPHPAIDVSVAHPARRYNYWLGGKDNFAADRASADQIAETYPQVREAARANRAFLQRATRFLTEEAGLRQFLDIGTGLPTADNTHEVAQRIAPETRVVYVDNDPLVMTHARALLTSTRQGETAYLEADLRDPGLIIREARETLDLSRPVGLMLIAVLHFIPGQGAAQPLVRELLDALPSGSYLTVTHATADFDPVEARDAYEALQHSGRAEFWTRRREEIETFFEGLEMVEPGLSPITGWRPPAGAEVVDGREVKIWGGMGRKP
jgi:hypothetical protein